MTTEWFDPIWIEEKLSQEWSWRKIAKKLGKAKSTVNDRYVNYDRRRTKANLEKLVVPIRKPPQKKRL